ncbi:hypothetical protein LX97_01244 [Nonlabens dokdonensis]|uniref:MepB family protein n=2 Tax=Nonlabens dokdonensis TaxID=328515 RepID=L7W8V1_NONDD|nr:MepB family protein [Nonlabens dokdonensis]AGC76584.1 MepB family protein [Nonlabens dokdonensis DSW-6]PZX44234.1 hypothetical protein LX97_01244 [Nonlabens dokdonensis]
MNDRLKEIKEQVYGRCNLYLTYYQEELESKEYDACRFRLNDAKIISRSSKITPKKAGQFVTFWKRNGNGPIEPFEESDAFDFFVVNVRTEKNFGQFVFPKSVLVKKGIVSTSKKEGKRAIRVYPSWDQPTNATAMRSQKWQLGYFFEVNEKKGFEKLKTLYKNK